MSSQEEQLEAILDAHAEYYIKQTMKFFQEGTESPALSRNNKGDLTAKSAITALIQEAVNEGRVAELKQIEPPEQYEDYARLAGREDCAICGFNAVKFRTHILDRIKSLSGGSNNGG